MDVREKLVELIDDIQVRGEDFTDYEIYGMRVPDTVSNEDVASHLIAHGVTVQEWISVNDRLPEKPMKCLVYTKRGEYGGYEITYYNEGFYLQYANVTHWMPLPDEPEVKND